MTKVLTLLLLGHYHLLIAAILIAIVVRTELNPTFRHWDWIFWHLNGFRISASGQHRHYK